MTSHLEMYNAQLTLQDQVIKLRVALVNAGEEEKVMHSLSKLYVLPEPFLQKLTSCFLDQNNL